MKSLNESFSPIDLAAVNLAAASKRRAGRGAAPRQDQNNKKEVLEVQLPTLHTRKEKELQQGYNNINDYDTTNSSCPNMNELVDTLGPYEWLDDEIIKLSYMFESGVLVSPDHENNNNNINVTNDDNILDSDFGVLVGNNDGGSGGVWSSSNGAESGECNSSVNSVYEYQWPDMHLEGSCVQSYNQQWDLCDQQGQDANCFWDTSNYQESGFYH